MHRFILKLTYVYSEFSYKILEGKHIYTEKELFALIAKGDEQAYKQLFQRYFQQLIAVMIQYTHIRFDAEDIVQSVFLKVWDKRKELSVIKNPESWLFITAKNELLGRFRKLRSEDRYRHYLTQVFKEEMDLTDFLLMQQRDDLVHQAILLLPEKQREAFFLNRYKGLTYEEIADKMQISRTTVKEHISRALKSITSFLLERRNELLSIGLFFNYFFHFYVLLFGIDHVFIL